MVLDRAYVYKTGQPEPTVIEKYTTIYSDLEKGVETGEITHIEFDGLAGVTLFALSETPEEELKRRAKEVYPLAVELRTALVREKRIGQIRNTLGAAIIPPIVMLLLGLAVGWVVAGFRRRQTS